jgi:hypothetical protein
MKRGSTNIREDTRWPTSFSSMLALRFTTMLGFSRMGADSFSYWVGTKKCQFKHENGNNLVMYSLVYS